MLGRVNGPAALLAIAAGLAGSVQVAVMARLGERVGVFSALAWATFLTAALAFVLLLVVGQSASGFVDAARQPVWLWSGALLSLLIVFTVTYSGSRLGIVATVAILIAGQLAMGAVIDRFGMFGAERVTLSWHRILGITLLAVGAALTLRR
jgi:transporter family-2 protein